MNSHTALRVLMIRLPSDLYEAATALASRRGISIDLLVEESVAATVRADEEYARYEAYSLLGQDAEASDVAFADYAQAEVMLHAGDL
jgi:hypothetical protein